MIFYNVFRVRNAVQTSRENSYCNYFWHCEKKFLPHGLFPYCAPQVFTSRLFTDMVTQNLIFKYTFCLYNRSRIRVFDVYCTRFVPLVYVSKTIDPFYIATYPRFACDHIISYMIVIFYEWKNHKINFPEAPVPDQISIHTRYYVIISI
jgi:hypothetical protein